MCMLFELAWFNYRILWGSFEAYWLTIYVAVVQTMCSSMPNQLHYLLTCPALDHLWGNSSAKEQAKVVSINCGQPVSDQILRVFCLQWRTGKIEIGYDFVLLHVLAANSLQNIDYWISLFWHTSFRIKRYSYTEFME